MLDLHRELKALKPDEPDEEIEKDLAEIRRQKPGITDEEILGQAKTFLQSGGQVSAAPAPTASPASPEPPSAPPPEPEPFMEEDRPGRITGQDAAIAALQGLAGYGDAIARGFGGTQTDFLKTSIAVEQQAKDNRAANRKAISERMKEQREGQKAKLETLLKGSKDKFEMEEKLRDGFTTATKSFQTIRDQYGTLQSAAANPSAAGDLSLIFAYMKLVDPGSTVREGEFANAQNAAGVDERVRSMWNRALNGERLTEKTRGDFVSQAQGIYNTQRKGFEATKGLYDELAARNGLSPENVTSIVVGDAQKPPAKSGAPAADQPPKVTSQQEYDRLPSGAEYIAPDGTRKRKK